MEIYFKMLFAKIIDGVVVKYPYKLDDLKKDYPNISFPRNIQDLDLSRYNVFPVIVQEISAFDQITQYVVEDTTPVYIDGNWVITQTVIDYTPEEMEKKIKAVGLRIRKLRDKLLSECDWTLAPDAPVDKAAWTAYRQQLRDLTGLSNFPFLTASDWPTKPQ